MGCAESWQSGNPHREGENQEETQEVQFRGHEELTHLAEKVAFIVSLASPGLALISAGHVLSVLPVLSPP